MSWLAVLQLEAESPVERVEAADAGQDTVEAGERDCRCLRERLRRDQSRTEQLAGERHEVVQRAVDIRAGRAPQLGAHFERHEDGLGEVLGKGDLGPSRDVLREHVEAVIRVDPPRAGAREGRTGVEWQPACVCEQVAYRRAGRAGGLVELERSLFRGHERRQCGRELRHRRPAKAVLRRTVRVDGALGSHDGGRGVVGGPAVDLAERVHRGRY